MVVALLDYLVVMEEFIFVKLMTCFVFTKQVIIKFLMKKFNIYIHFYLSTLFITLPLSIIAFFIDSVFFVFTFILYSNLVVYLFKKIYKEKEYYFYYNLNISKLELYTFCILINIIFSIFILLIYGQFS